MRRHIFFTGSEAHFDLMLQDEVLKIPANVTARFRQATRQQSSIVSLMTGRETYAMRLRIQAVRDQA
jgi:hypothetical protein